MSSTAAAEGAGRGPSAVAGMKPLAPARGTQPRSAPRPKGEGGLGWRSPHAWVGVFCLVAIAVGWRSRGNLGLSPADGLGYALGIAGLAMMTLLLGYSIRKRVRGLRHAGPLRTWFEIHLMLGLLGPTAILYHSDFNLGSANATISLACMLAVSGSGIGGRFLYGRMHRGLAGSRRKASNMQKQAHAEIAPLVPLLEREPRARALLETFERRAIGGAAGFFRSFGALRLRPSAWMTRRRVLRLLRSSTDRNVKAAASERAVSGYLGELCRAGELRLFEQLFSLWHAIHVPLTIILFVSAVIHIVAVHLY